MKSTSLLAIAGAVGGTALAATGAAVLLLGDGEADARPAATAAAHRDAGGLGRALRAAGATGCVAEQARVECRYEGRYVAAAVFTPDTGMTVETALESWKSGVGQSALGEQGAFSLLRGPNWLVTGPRAMVDKVRPELGGDALHCDRPFGACA
ncbi:hypothetical protein ACSNOI_08365 [Actinomadura kijaniata]|uniref:hypothetical protein n=1 Tax=Actinomadura kijaniata TaxID=46161 RepID=UPI003F1A4B60